MRNESIKDLVDSFNEEYYVSKIESIIKRIENLKLGLDEYDGMQFYPYYNPQKLTKEEAQEKIISLELELDNLQKKYIELKTAVSYIRLATDKIDNLAKNQALLAEFNNSVRKYLKKYKNNTGLFSSIGIFRRKYTKLHYKSSRKIFKNSYKINKNVYKILKQNSRKIVDGLTINKKVKDSGYKMENLFEQMLTQMSYDYRINKLQSLGVDVKRLQNANNVMAKDNLNFFSMTPIGIDAGEKVNVLNNLILNNYASDDHKKYSSIISLKDDYHNIVNLSKEIWYMQELIECFKDTQITDSKLYSEIQHLKNKQSKDLEIMHNELDRVLKKNGLSILIQKSKELSELHNELIYLQSKKK